MRRLLLPIALILLAGCGKDSDPDPALPHDALVLRDYLDAGVDLVLPSIARFDERLPFLLNPGAPGSAGVSLLPDPSPGAPEHSYIFDVALDGDGDGLDESRLTGRCQLNGPPGEAIVGFGGTVELAVSSVGGLGDFSGTLEFELVSEGTQITGGGSFSEDVTGNTTTLQVAEGSALLVRMATGAAGAVANACAYSLEGTMELQVSGPLGTLSTDAGFSSDRRPVAMTGGRFIDGEGTETPLPPRDYEVPCGGGSLEDWVGLFEQDYGCIPAESGSARLTMTRKNATTIRIEDEDPPGSGETNSYEATMLAGTPHIVRGFFVSGPPGNTYREEFTWTLSADRQRFSQVSAYRYLEGTHTFPGGLCSGSAHRSP